MKTGLSDTQRWWTVALFAAGMAWVESAVVYYLRTMIDRLEPYQADPLPMIGGLGRAELVREAATLLMLLTVGILAGKNWRGRLGYAAFAFGLWDVLYYVFLKVMYGWPHSLLDWDILFLLPLPWWGPVLAPVSIAALMMVWGTLATQCPAPPIPRWVRWRGWGLNVLGMGLALYVFMLDALRVADQGADAIRKVLPAQFHWPLFLLALGLMSIPIVQQCQALWRAGAFPAVGRWRKAVAFLSSVPAKPGDAS